ncbi:NAD(P)H-hydrate dehydratase [Pseudochelatococcus sp. G4_1912]|uniref:NAD(P)H-hydrate dehydratase n=1 Tax=Pseudochelatococcus sp. G4_1912 TaxID=3114288 RepID=UPI0039C6D96E
MGFLLTTSQMREADSRTIIAGTSGYTLMQRAGHAVAEWAARQAHASAQKDGVIVVLCGPGNNGGDGFVAARVLAAKGFSVRLVLLGTIETLKGDAAEAADDWSGDVLPMDKVVLDDAIVIIDALFGAGLDRDLAPDVQALIGRINASAAPVIAVDIPSGIDGDSGAIRGQAVKADITVTFVSPKPGHLLYPGRAHCGQLQVEDIGISSAVAKELSAGLAVNSPDSLVKRLIDPPVTAHKYGRGHALIISGPTMHTGAARLTARAALRVGAGLVTVASPQDALAENAAHLTAIMLREVDNAAALSEILTDTRFNALAMGPGCGVGEDTVERVRAAGASVRALVLDADALTSFSGNIDAFRAAIELSLSKGVVLTPHEGEFARLFANEAEILNASSKLVRAQLAARRVGAVVVLKGADTIIAAPDGRAAINDNGSPWLATAGSGDVLTGLITGLLAQGLETYEAARVAVWLHGAAGQLAGAGLIAEDLPELMPQVLKGLIKRGV